VSVISVQIRKSFVMLNQICYHYICGIVCIKFCLFFVLFFLKDFFRKYQNLYMISVLKKTGWINIKEKNKQFFLAGFSVNVNAQTKNVCTKRAVV